MYDTAIELINSLFNHVNCLCVVSAGLCTESLPVGLFQVIFRSEADMCNAQVRERDGIVVTSMSVLQHLPDKLLHSIWRAYG